MHYAPVYDEFDTIPASAKMLVGNRHSPAWRILDVAKGACKLVFSQFCCACYLGKHLSDLDLQQLGRDYFLVMTVMIWERLLRVADARQLHAMYNCERRA